MFHIIVVVIIRIYRSIVASVKSLFVIGRYIVALVSELNLSVCVCRVRLAYCCWIIVICRLRCVDESAICIVVSTQLDFFNAYV